MKYSNPLPAEDINVTPSNPLKEALLLSSALVAILLLIGVLITWSADFFIPKIPFATEKALLADYQDLFPNDDAEIQTALQTLVDNLAKSTNFPKDITFSVHYVDDPTVNAAATLGGNLLIFRGLLERMPHENALSTVLAHEMAHVLHRHPVRAAGRGVIFALLLAVIGMNTGDYALGNVIGNASLLQTMHYSREYEREADATALKILQQYYGHAAGANDMFAVLAEYESENEEPDTRWELLRSHPLNAARQHAAQQQIGDNASELPLTPLPKILRLETIE
ncbi:MAG: M48 family metallopeptidase [Mariprofundales bacterium]